MNLEWKDSHGKKWLVITLKDNSIYEVPFNKETLCIDDFVLLTHKVNPPLIKGMISPTLFFNEEVGELLSDEENAELDAVIEKFQAPAKG